MASNNTEHYLALLQTGRWFSAIPKTLQNTLLQLSQLKTLVKGETLFSRGDAPCGLYAVLEGAIRVTGTNNEGKEALLTLLEPPSWIGEVSLFDRQPRTHDVIADTPTTLLHVPQQALKQLLTEHPSYWREFGLLLTQKIRLTFNAIEDLTLLPASNRLTRRLIMMAESYGESGSINRSFIKIQQEQLGSMLSISRQTTNQILKDLESKKLIQLAYGGIEVPDLAQLKAFAGLSDS